MMPKVHLATANPAYPACGSSPVPLEWIERSDRWLKEPHEKRCLRCERSLAGEKVLKSADTSKPEPT